MDLSGIAVNLKGEIPIIVGTIPLRQNFAELTQAHIEAGDAINQTHIAPPELNDYPDLRKYSHISGNPAQIVRCQFRQ